MRSAETNALVASASGQSREQRATYATPLPVVDDGHGHLSGVRLVVRADVPREAHQLPARRVDGDDRLVVVVVDVVEVVQIRRRQLVQDREEPPVA